MTDASGRQPAGGTVRAAHAARGKGDRRLAAALFLEAHQPFEAAVCFYEIGDRHAALKAFLMVPIADRRYRRACVQAVRVACELGDLSYELDQFLQPFLQSGPATEDEQSAVYDLARAHEDDHTPDVAAALWTALVRVAPGYRDATSRLRALVIAAHDVEEHAHLEEQVAFWRPQPSPHRTLPPPPRPSDLPPPVRSSAPPRHDLPRPPMKSEVASIEEDLVVSASGDAPSGEGSSLQGATDSGPRSVSADDADAANAVKPSIFEVRRPWTDPSGRKSTPPSAPSSEASGRSVLEQGSIVAERYRIDAELGRGGMGVVYQATDLELNHPVAMKLLSIASGQGDMLQRFKLELTLCRQIAHPNVIRLYDIGAHGDFRFITMELLAGESLRTKLTDGIKLSKAVQYLKQICAGLDAIHGLGIVHRDLKPDNVFVGNDDVLKLMDFGLAKSLRATSSGSSDPLTRTGFLAGTPGFMAPEQFTSFGSVTEQADLYSLGVLAYQLLTGSRPFQSAQQAAILELQLTTVPEPPSKLTPRLTPRLDAVILKMLHKDAGARPSARDLSEALSEMAR